MERQTQKSKALGYVALGGGIIFLVVGLIANALPAAYVMQNYGENPSYAGGFLAGFFVIVGVSIGAIIFGARRLRS